MFNPPRMVLQEVHLRISAEVWRALREYAEFAGESSLSQAVRKLLRERLTELGFFKEKTRFDK